MRCQPFRLPGPLRRSCPGPGPPLLGLALLLLLLTALGARPAAAEAVVLTADSFAATTQGGKATFVKVTS